MSYPINSHFNPAPPLKMHLDINSCFATIEQQHDTSLRHRPIAVAANTQNFGCIVAPSIEAKSLGIKTGHRVGEAKKICPGLVVLPPDIQRYRTIHHKFHQLLTTLSTQVTPLSIDEFNLEFADQPDWAINLPKLSSLIKKSIQDQIGDYITVSVGLAPCFSLAKLAANLQKPDGFSIIDKSNHQSIYSRLDLKDLPGINHGYSFRLHLAGLGSVTKLYQASPKQLKSAFGSIIGYHWYRRLRGWSTPQKTTRRSFSNSHVVYPPFSSRYQLKALLHKLLHKATIRSHQAQLLPCRVKLKLNFVDSSVFKDSVCLNQPIINSLQAFYLLEKLLKKAPFKTTKKVSVTLSDLVPKDYLPLKLFDSTTHQHTIGQLMDSLNQRFGKFTLTPARLVSAHHQAPDHISFGQIA